MTYQEAIAYLESFVDYEKLMGYVYDPVRFNLARPRRLLAALRDPQERFDTIHIAGTKGKGSTAIMTDAILRAAGFRTGLFTKPHLVSFRERIVTDGQLIPEADLAALLQRVQPIIEEHKEHAVEGRLSFFEIYTALALLYFAERGVDIAVMECGLGGRLDATNVLAPLVCAITPIGIDHTAELGDTLAAIAMEKAGIIKPHTPVVIAPQDPQAGEVILAAARDREADVYSVAVAADAPSTIAVAPGRVVGEGQTFSVTCRPASGAGAQMHELHLPVIGRHQLANAGVAVGIIAALCNKSKPEHAERDWPAAIRDGLSQVELPGRLQTCERDPFLIVDSAHTRESAAAARDALEEFISYDRLVLILGCLHGKNVRAVTEELSGVADEVILTAPDTPRALPVDKLWRQVQDVWPEAHRCPSAPGAVALARKLARPQDAILVTGSLYLAGDILGLLRVAIFEQRSQPA
ncbi:MAG: bifunctional folylpolyglutamate synthase/dihydrofolate synthase [Armatimonadota bacterium]